MMDVRDYYKDLMQMIAYSTYDYIYHLMYQYARYFYSTEDKDGISQSRISSSS